MKKNVLAAIFMVFVLTIAFAFAGCSNNKEGQKVLLSADNLLSILGQTKEETFEALSIDPSSDVTETNNSGKQEKITLKEPFEYREKQVKAALLFYDNVFFGVEYIFEDSESEGFTLAKSVYDSNEKIYGTATTYPTLPNRIKDLDEEQFNSAKDGQWMEQWAVAGKENLVKHFKADGKGSLILRMTLNKRTTEQSTTTILSLIYTVQ